MDDQSNVTYLTLDGYVEVDKYRYLYFCSMFAAYILIICCNVTTVCVIVIHPNLHQPMYIFIAALLINSVLFSSAIYPKLLMDFMSDRQIISYPACLLQFLLFYSLTGSEFFLLAAMAYDRYVSICKPLQYPSIMRRSTVCTLLVLAWFIPVCELSVQVILSAEAKLCSFTLKGILCNNTIYGLQCVRSRVITIYGVFLLLGLVIVPTLFIIFTYTKILIISYHSGRDVRRKAAETCLPHLLVLISLSCLITYDVIIARVESNFPKTARLIMTLQMSLYHPLFNPLIYGLKMKEISKQLKSLFCQTKVM